MSQISTTEQNTLAYREHIDDRIGHDADDEHRRRVRECNERQVHPFCRGG
ncbi:hypothetical protein ACWDT6_19640 [Nocardia grenadensis]